MKQKIGERYSCSNCGTVLDSQIFWLDVLLIKLPIGKAILECPNCHTKYIGKKRDLFNDNKKLFFYELFIYFLLWVIPFIIIGWIICDLIGKTDDTSYYIVLVALAIIFIIVFKIKWNNAIRQSRERLNNKDYLSDLLSFNLITENQITDYYKQNIITKKIYDEVITKKHQKVKELIEELDKINKKMMEENKAKEKKINETAIKLKNSKNSKKKYCTECGTEIESSWKFCHECGNKLK